MDSVLPPKLLTLLSAAADAARSHDFIQIFSHHDSDGLSSAGILANTMKRAGKQFSVRIFPVLNADNLEIIKNCEAKCIIVSDLGAYYISELEKIENKTVIVLDHHSLNGDSDKIFYANPLLFGSDGMQGACGATMCMLFSLQMDPNNWDLVQIAFGGITGDRQTINGITGFNRYLLEGGIEKGFLEVRQGSIIPAGGLSQSLYHCTSPYIRGITGNTNGIAKLLADAGIGNDRTYDSLNENEKRKLSSLIVTKLTEMGMTLSAIREFTKPRYYLKELKTDSDSFSKLLDACGRKETYGVGVAICLGSEDDRLRAMEYNEEMDDAVTKAILDLDSKKPVEMENIQYFDATEYGYNSALCAIVMKCIGNPEKPTVGYNLKEGKIRVSARGTYELIDKGLNLADALHIAAESVGGEGGGHKIASGASIEPGNETEFLKKVDETVGAQIGAR